MSTDKTSSYTTTIGWYKHRAKTCKSWYQTLHQNAAFQQNKTASHSLRHQIRSITLAQYQPQATGALTSVDIWISKYMQRLDLLALKKDDVSSCATGTLTRVDICSQLNNQQAHANRSLTSATPNDVAPTNSNDIVSNPIPNHAKETTECNPRYQISPKRRHLGI
ncbi:putative LRR receptor-like serine/threonine-protein kinase [Dorcoceras hygrometricum]|uniref:Putative LRR receptor-like serine/threonine-protein kinase n=1 Tax=Dorcoceras hygrometricum TaxID=472368 RepID=A0A2Z7ABK0_9LAMI|nr:putative LRR receptor-like serine/threonine-protein kinase [Dorcoceras hygrometricum]